jgi:hypothetical protein
MHAPQHDLASRSREKTRRADPVRGRWVTWWGEYGRTPRINNNSRDHWPQNNAALVAGGGMRTGQTIGRSNRLGEHPVDRPVKFQEVFATLYRCAGIDQKQVRIFDQAGTPQYLVDEELEPM